MCERDAAGHYARSSLSIRLGACAILIGLPASETLIGSVVPLTTNRGSVIDRPSGVCHREASPESQPSLRYGARGVEASDGPCEAAAIPSERSTPSGGDRRGAPEARRCLIGRQAPRDDRFGGDRRGAPEAGRCLISRQAPRDDRVGGTQRPNTLPTPGISGAALLRDDRLLLVSDRGNAISLLSKASENLASPAAAAVGLRALEGELKGRVDLDDLEDAAWDGHGNAYLVASHSRTSLGDAPDARYRLARLSFDATGKLLEARQTDALLQGIVNQVPFLADAIRRTPARTGLNIEGLAWTPEDHLLIGLRAPTVTESRVRPHGGQEDAVVLRLKNPAALFQALPPRPEFGDVVKLDLRGQGIRGMAYDPDRKACWIVSGLSAEPTHPVKSPWDLWLWDEKAEPRRARLPSSIALEQPEAVCRLGVKGRPHLLLIEPREKESRYAMLLLEGFGFHE